MARPIRLEKFSEKIRQVRGRSFLPERNQRIDGTRLTQQLNQAVSSFRNQLSSRADLPQVPEGIQVLIKGNTSSSGRSILESAKLRGLKLQVLEERPDGYVIALSADTNVVKLQEAVGNFRTDARTSSGRRKGGVNTIFAIDDISLMSREFKMGEDLVARAPFEESRRYVVDIEIAAGLELGEDSRKRISEFDAYLRADESVIFGQGAIKEEDYALYRAEVTGALLNDMLDNHVWVTFID